ncbi:MAG: Crp/Fnr family transcriptional regulator [Bacteroidota bacterium]|nr:Crp/Fnr family transcriptional regulator [Bacteroidota bacterium]
MNELKLKQSFDKYFDAPIEVWKSFTDLCQEVKFKKNEIIKATGHAEKNAYFIMEGACGVFLWKENSFACLDIVLENNFFADHMSLITEQPSPLETIALEKTTALRISTNNIAKLKKSTFGTFLFLLGAENSFVEKQQQQIDLLTKTAEQRYEELMNKNPQVIQRIAQKHVASYLGITTQSLSRIRNNR